MSWGGLTRHTVNKVGKDTTAAQTVQIRTCRGGFSGEKNLGLGGRNKDNFVVLVLQPWNWGGRKGCRGVAGGHVEPIE